jgi:hypothetical protein
VTRSRPVGIAGGEMANRIRNRARVGLAVCAATLLAATFTTGASAGAATLPQLSVQDAEWREEEPSTSFAEVYVELSNPSSSTVEFDYTTADGTAFSGTDYSPVHGTLALAPGDTSALIEVAILRDDVVEDTEHFFVQIFNPVNATIADARATVTELNALTDTDPPSAAIFDTGVREGDSGDTVANFLVRLGARSSSERTVTVQTREVANGATEGVDYDPVTTVLTFPAGVLTKRFQVNVNGDTVDEPDEQLRAVIVFAYSDIAASYSDGTADGIVYDDDQPSSK